MMRIRPSVGDKVHCGSWTGERRRCSRSKRVLRRNCCCVEKDVHVCMHQYKMESDRLFTFTLCVLEKDVQVACISTKWNLIDYYSVTQPTRSDYM